MLITFKMASTPSSVAMYNLQLLFSWLKLRKAPENFFNTDVNTQPKVDKQIDR